jgi:hypothetical protein
MCLLMMTMNQGSDAASIIVIRCRVQWSRPADNRRGIAERNCDQSEKCHTEGNRQSVGHLCVAGSATLLRRLPVTDEILRSSLLERTIRPLGRVAPSAQARRQFT